jgi:hypothetical protein
MAEAAGAVLAALGRVEEAAHFVQAFDARQEQSAQRVADTLRRTIFNPALNTSMRREYGLAAGAGRLWNSRLAGALERESDARSVLAELRHREQGLARSIAHERRKNALRRQHFEHLAADESWLQQHMGTGR